MSNEDTSITSDVATADGQDRYVRSGAKDIMSAGHEGVYEWIAANLVTEGTRALDFGCGTGYGVARLAEAGATADGVDLSPTAIDYATKTFGRPGVRFFVADLVKPLPESFERRSYDLVVSSEVLEHVVDPFAYVRSMADVLRDDGACFVGTPNRLWSKANLPWGRLVAPSHLMEFTPPALIALLHTVFDEVDLTLRLFPEGSIDTTPEPVRHPRSRLVRYAAAVARRIAPSRVEQVKKRIDERPAPPSRAWAPADIIWVNADDPNADTRLAAGLAAVCRRPRRNLPEGGS